MKGSKNYSVFITDKMEVIGEDDKSYTVLVNNEKTTKFFKIDSDELKIKHLKDLQEAEKYISKRNLDMAMFFVGGLLKYHPTIDKYEESANNVVGLLKRFHFDLKPHGLTHLVNSLIKDIDLDTYGKGQTFLHHLRLWYKDLKVINDFRCDKEGNGS